MSARLTPAIRKWAPKLWRSAWTVAGLMCARRHTFLSFSKMCPYRRQVIKKERIGSLAKQLDLPDSYPDPSPGGGECGLGRAQDPWGTLEARLRRLRTQRRPISATRSTPRRSLQPLVGLPRQPPRGDRRLRFRHRPTLTFQLLSCFFVIEHHRRTILHFNVTREPTAAWVVQQLRDVFPGEVHIVSSF